MLDRTGKALQLGQTVDIYLNGIYTGVIVAIHETHMMVSKNKQAPPQLAIQMVLTHIPNDGQHAGVYIIAEPESVAEPAKIELVQ